MVVSKKPTSLVTQKNLVALFAAGIVPLRKEVGILKTSVSLPHSVFKSGSHAC
jgi:hypothetical protein